MKYLLDCDKIKRATRDSFGSTPFLRAAQNKHKDIVRLLSPADNVQSLSEDAIGAVKGFNATIVDFGNFHNENRVSRKSLFDVLYGHDKVNPRKLAFTILPKDNATTFRWIHLPANNMAWVEALLTKLFIEEDASDVEGFKALERSFSHQHRGQQSHSHFMRPLCQITPRAAMSRLPEVESFSLPTEPPPPSIVLNGETLSKENTLPRTPTQTSNFVSGEDKNDGMKVSSRHISKDQSRGIPKSKKTTTQGNKSPKGAQTPNKDEQRKPSQNPIRRKLRSPLSPGRKEATHISKGNVYTFMPYLHFETKQRCQEMQQAIKIAELMKTPHRPHLLKGKMI